jgi:gliding motility-associated lipoprotein GldH
VITITNREEGRLKRNMKKVLFGSIFMLAFVGCDDTRVAETYTDLTNNQWIQQEKIRYEFKIRDLGKSYNLLCNIRNSSDYPYARLFLGYTLKDSTGTTIANNLVSTFLFDAKSGHPLGTSGVGDIFDNQIMLLEKYSFNYPGRYTLELEQEMRLDTLAGIHAVGYRLEISKETL